MGKRRNSKNNPYIISGGGGGTPENAANKFSAFEFSDDDRRVETDSAKILSKFKRNIPNKRPLAVESVDKYDFLHVFARGSSTQQTYSGNETIDIDVSDNISEDRSLRPDVTVSSYSSKNWLGTSRYPRDVHSSCSVQSCTYRSREAGDCKTKKKHGNISNQYSTLSSSDNSLCCIDSDEDKEMELHSSTSSDVPESISSKEERLQQHGSLSNDCEVLVVVSPDYIKYQNIFHTKCSLSFSSRYIRLECSNSCPRKRSHRHGWLASDILKIECLPCEIVGADAVTLHLKRRDSDVNEICFRNSGIIELEFVVHDDSQWSRKQEEIKSLNLKYEGWEVITSDFNLIEHIDDIVYPEGDADAVSIGRGDIELLKPRTFINDTIIDFYIKYLLRKNSPLERQRIHSFNTFFFRKLADINWDSPGTGETGKAFQRVRKWTRNINLFEKDFIFLPVNSSLHWSLIIVCHPGEVANLREKDVDDASKNPCILHMDSLRGSHRGLENIIRSYLCEEWKACNGKHDADTLTKFSNLHFEALQLPQQENLFDCGLFLLHYAELFLAQVVNFSTARISSLTEDWFLPAEVSLKKRDHIRKLIYKIGNENTLKDPLHACKDRHLPSDAIGRDNNVEVVQESNAKESLGGIKFISGTDHEIRDQQSFQDMSSPKNSIKSVIRRLSLTFEEEADEKQPTCFPVEATRHQGDAYENTYTTRHQNDEYENTNTTRHQNDEYENTTPWHSSPNSFMVGGIPVYYGNSETRADTFNTDITLQLENGHVPEVSSTEDKFDYSPMSCEDLADRVVEDSEVESGQGRVQNTLRSFCSPEKIIHVL